ncbi:MAG: tetratricopeptide repeat protein, partial [Cyanobacteria bacterium P01_H01_bin.121]
LIASARRNSPADVASLLETLRSLQLGKLDFDAVTESVQAQLADLDQQPISTQKPLQEATLLQELVYNYEQAQQWQEAIAGQEQLATLYRQIPSLNNRLPKLQWSIGQNQEAAGDLEAATRTYRYAYQLAQSLTQFATAQEVLLSLGNLYRQEQGYEQAIQTYQILLQVNRNSRDAYGLLDAYDRLGEMYLAVADIPSAEDSFSRALNLARQLQYIGQETRQLEHLAALYTDLEQWDFALAMRNQLAEIYPQTRVCRNTAKCEKLAEAKLAIAELETELSFPLEEIQQTYLEAYQFATRDEQRDLRNKALLAIAQGYEALEQTDGAILAYRLLIENNNRLVNTFRFEDVFATELFEAYRRLAAIYNQVDNREEAKELLEAALTTAKFIESDQVAGLRADLRALKN